MDHARRHLGILRALAYSQRILLRRPVIGAITPCLIAALSNVHVVPSAAQPGEVGAGIGPSTREPRAPPQREAVTLTPVLLHLGRLARRERRRCNLG